MKDWAPSLPTRCPELETVFDLYLSSLSRKTRWVQEDTGGVPSRINWLHPNLFKEETSFLLSTELPRCRLGHS